VSSGHIYADCPILDWNVVKRQNKINICARRIKHLQRYAMDEPEEEEESEDGPNIEDVKLLDQLTIKVA